MKEFADLFCLLDQTNKTNEKIALLKHYFLSAPEQDKIWALALFTGRRPKRQINGSLIRKWLIQGVPYPQWLYEESYFVVGDFAETISLLYPDSTGRVNKSLAEWFEFLLSLNQYPEEVVKEKIEHAMQNLGSWEKFVFIKLISGSFRIGVSQNLVIRAISEAFNIENSIVAHRIMGDWTPEAFTFQELIHQERESDTLSRPYPFCLAHSLEGSHEAIGPPDEWQAEWKWDGIRSQLILRAGEIYIWSRGEELVTEKFPELHFIKDCVKDDLVLDGEILAYQNDMAMPFAVIQTRIGRKNLTKNILKDAPIIFMAYDLLEYKNFDFRKKPLSERRFILSKVLDECKLAPHFILSPAIQFSSWEELYTQWVTSRKYLAEGMMLKKHNSTYETGRKRGTWWKWKIDPMSIDGVLVYAQKGHGRRADLYSDYTFAVWEGDTLVPFAKAYSGLTDEELKQVDSFIKKNILEKFGPIRTVRPELVFEIGFEGIQESRRHKSGVALRFPRILKWRTDKKVEDADTLDTLKSILKNYNAGYIEKSQDEIQK